MNAEIKRGEKNWEREFSEFLKLSSPELFPKLFGSNCWQIFRKLYLNPKTLFSYRNTIFAVKTDSHPLGMLLGYDWKTKRRGDLPTGFQIFIRLGWKFLLRLPTLLIAEQKLGKLERGDFYISNLAVLPRYRGRGLATQLLSCSEELARKSGCQRLVLDVELENKPAQSLYRKLGFSVEDEHSLELKGGPYQFFRMAKKLR